jgi:glycosyltransferase involved in cell wall biosynthesis
VLLTSHMEANPICLMEALASEKPVVAVRVGSVTETVLEGKTGFLVAPGDTRAMAQRLHQLLVDCDLAAVLGRAGREHVLAHASVDSMVKGYQDLIAEKYASKCRPITPPPSGDLADVSVQGTMAH